MLPRSGKFNTQVSKVNGKDKVNKIKMSSGKGGYTQGEAINGQVSWSRRMSFLGRHISSNPQSSSGKSPTVTTDGLTKAPYLAWHSKQRFPFTLQGMMGKAVVRGPQSGSLLRCQDRQAHPVVHAYAYTYMHTYASINTKIHTQKHQWPYLLPAIVFPQWLIIADTNPVARLEICESCAGEKSQRNFWIRLTPDLCLPTEWKACPGKNHSLLPPRTTAISCPD